MRISHLEQFLKDLKANHPVVTAAYQNLVARTHTPSRVVRSAFPDVTVLPSDDLYISLEAIQKNSPVQKEFDGVRQGHVTVKEAVRVIRGEEPPI